jgi:hypothetical protein
LFDVQWVAVAHTPNFARIYHDLYISLMMSNTFRLSDDAKALEETRNVASRVAFVSLGKSQKTLSSGASGTMQALKKLSGIPTDDLFKYLNESEEKKAPATSKHRWFAQAKERECSSAWAKPCILSSGYMGATFDMTKVARMSSTFADLSAEGHRWPRWYPVRV